MNKEKRNDNEIDDGSQKKNENPTSPKANLFWVILVVLICSAAWMVPLFMYLGKGLFGADGAETTRLVIGDFNEDKGYSESNYTAEQVAGRFMTLPEDKGMYYQPYAYQKEYSVSADRMAKRKIPDGNTIDVYAVAADLAKDVDVTAFSQFADPIIDNIAKWSQTPAPSYTVVNNETVLSANASFLANGTSEMISARITQNQYRTQFSLTDNTGDLEFDFRTVNGASMMVSESMSNAQISKSLDAARQQLNALFGENFANVYVNRTYTYNDMLAPGSDLINPGVCMYVMFYNENELPFDSSNGIYFSNYIELYYNYSLKQSHNVFPQSIEYVKRRVSPKELFPEADTLRRVTIEEALELIAKGYTFTGELCPNCLPESERVDFSNYDAVELCYFEKNARTENNNDLPYFIPMYEFYKQTGTTTDGFIKYQIVRVPAFDVVGYEEYFASHSDKHKSN